MKSRATAVKTISAKPAAAPLFKDVYPNFVVAQTARQSIETARDAHKLAVTRLDKELAAAVKAEDFLKAAKLKEERDLHAKSLGATKAQLADNLSTLSELRATAEKSFFAEHAKKHPPVFTQLYWITVADPTTGSHDTAFYLSSDDSIQVHLNGACHEVDAGHADGWASRQGYFVQRGARQVVASAAQA